MRHASRSQSFIIITLCYIVTAVIGICVFQILQTPHWFTLLIADLAATVFIWITSQLLQNASVYDPYWSVQPPIILALVYLFLGKQEPGSILLVLLIAFWGARLSINWMGSFTGLHKQDWRYDQLQEQSGRFFPLVNLFGIQVMPTLIVYTCLLPGFYYILFGGGMNVGVVFGLVIILGGAMLELVADYQMQVFRKQSPDRSQLIRTGIWRHSRHPNYLGEITVWWGVYLVMLSAYPELWYLGVGALANTCLFLFISIPMAEKRLATYKQNYDSYRQETRMLLPLPKHKK